MPYLVDGLRVFPNWKGAWALGEYYAQAEAVENNGSSYVCIVPHISIADSEPGVGVDTNVYWQLMAAKGSAGGGGGSVDSVFGRTGVVVAATSDYDSAQIDYDGTGSGLSAITAQAAIDELAAEKAPISHTHSLADITDSGALAAKNTIVNADVDASAAIAESKLALSFATHANTNDPTADQKAALAGTDGVPSVTNKFVTNSDSRNTDSRTPTSHASSHVGADAIQNATAAQVGLMTSTYAGKLDSVETGATADQSDSEIETAYNNQVPIATTAEAEAGTGIVVRRWTPQRVGEAIAALAGGGTDDQVAAEVPYDNTVSGLTATEVQSAVDELESTKAATSHTHSLAAITDSGALAAKDTIINADVDAAAAIVESKLSLNFATHANTNDPTADQKAALAGTSGVPSVGNKYVTNDDSRNTNARTPTAHTHNLADVTDSGALAALNTIANAQVDGAAAIAESKLALAFATHTNANDPTADQKAALAGTDGVPSTTNKYVTNSDSRNSDARTPTAHTHTLADVTDSGALAALNTIANAQVDGAAAIAESKLALAFATHTNANDPTADQKAALAGTDGVPSVTNKYVTNSDSRNSDARTPTAHTHTLADVTDSGALAALNTIANAQVDGAAAIAESKLALNFATHTNANDPLAGEKLALVGTSGTPGSGNKYVTNSDSRNSDARTPTSHASTHVGADAIQSATAAQIGLMTSTYAGKLDGIEAGAEVNLGVKGAMRCNFVASQRYASIVQGNSKTKDASAGSSTIFYAPFWTPIAATLTEIGIQVTTSTASGNARLAIFNDDGTGKPGDIILDAGEVSTSSTGIKVITISQSLSQGVCFIAARSNNSACQMKAIDKTEMIPVLGFSDGAANVGGVVPIYTETGTYGAFPSTATVGNPISADVPVVFIAP